MTEQPTTFIPLSEIPKKFESAYDAHSLAFEIARTGDVLGWRQLIKRIKPDRLNALVQWRQTELDGQQLKSKEQLTEIVDKAVERISPLISVALVGVESGREEFRDQNSLMDDLLNIRGRYPFEDTFWRNILYVLRYVYHSLHGSLCLSTNQLDLALRLARFKIPIQGGTEHSHVWQRPALMGWSELFGPNCIEGWIYLVKGYKKWPWLFHIFVDELEYRTSLVAYYMALSIHELASIIASGQQDILKPGSGFYFNVPLTFVSEGQDINQSAVLLLRRNPQTLTNLWTSLNVTREQMEYSWRAWIHLSELWLREIYGPSFYTKVFHQHLFEVL